MARHVSSVKTVTEVSQLVSISLIVASDPKATLKTDFAELASAISQQLRCLNDQ